MEFLNQVLTDVWKLWIIIGILFLIAETINAGTFALFFCGTGAFITAAACYIFYEIALSGTYQLLLFSATSLLSILIIRPIIKRNSLQEKNGHQMSDIVGKKGRALSELHKNKPGAVLFEGTEWSAFLSTDSHEPVEAGTEVVVTEIDGVKLKVKS